MEPNIALPHCRGNPHPDGIHRIRHTYKTGKQTARHLKTETERGKGKCGKIHPYQECVSVQYESRNTDTTECTIRFFIHLDR